MATGRGPRTEGTIASWLSEPAMGLIENEKRTSAKVSSLLLKKLVLELGIERATPHDLRRTWLTWITRLGVRPRRHG